MKENKKVKVIIFDYDGVIVDSITAGHNAYKEIAKAFGAKAPVTKEDFQEINEIPYIDIYKKWRITNKKDVARAHDIYLKTKMKNSKKIRLVPGITAVLNNLSKKYRLAIASGTAYAIIEQGIGTNGIKKYFEMVLGKEHHKNPKPAPDLLETCIKRLKIKPEEAIFIGDMVVDIQMGKAAGVKTIIVCSHSWNKKEAILRNNPDMHLESIEQLGEVL